MWNRLHFVAGVALLAIVAIFFSTRTIALQNPAPPPAGQTPAAPPPTGGTLSSTSNAGADFSPKPPLKARTPKEQAGSFLLPPGYRMELVLAEPDIVSPAVIRFDGNGRMYVAEFTTYMRDADGNNQHAPESRITRFESTKNDGVYDKRTVFVDKLVLPRTIVPLDGNSILTNETASDDIVKYTDTNNDGVADKREHVFSGIGLGRDGNLEHEQAGFVWGLDNWIYTTYNAFRIRWTPGGFLKEPTGPNSGSWGVTMDDDGKMWFIDAGGERGPMNFQVPIHYGAFTVPDQYEPGFHAVWPEIGLSDTQGGMVRVRMPVGRLNHLTAASGSDVVRAHRVPADLRGDLLISEPVGRLIRRARIVKDGGLTQLRNVYPGAEFITSTDPLFRPINITTAPDGSVYIADMYHGIIQESNWTRPGSYLRRKIEQYQMDKVIAHGRIWRLRFDGVPGVPATPAGPAAQATPEIPAQPALALDPTRPRMLQETPAQLVAHLSHENGWWRDTAQQLLVQRQDKSVVPALQNLVRSSNDLTARFHALWTLEGLNALDAGLVREQLKDPNPRMRVQAIRVSETLYKAANRAFADDYRAMTKDPDPDVALQALLTANLFKLPNIEALIKDTQSSNQAKGIQEIGRQMLQRIANAANTAAAFSPAQQEQLKEGETVYKTLCFSCHGDDGRGVAMAGAGEGAMMAPPLASSPRVQGHRDYVINTLLHGMTGPIAGTDVFRPGDAADGRAERSVDRQHRVVRSQQLRQHGVVRDAGGRRPGARGEQQPQDAVDLRRARRVAPAPAAGRSVMEGDREPQRRASRQRPDARRLDDRGSAGARHVVPGRTAAAGDGRRSAVRCRRTGRPGRRRRPRPAGPGPTRGTWCGTWRGRPRPPPRSGRSPCRCFGSFPLGYRVQVSMDGKSWSAPVAEGKGSPATTVATFRPVQARFIRVTQTDSRRERAALVGVELPGLHRRQVVGSMMQIRNTRVHRD